jgi:hypothetical protein
MERLRTPYVTVSKPDILRGMLIPAADAQFYSSVADIMETYFKNKPDGNVINKSADALYGAFDPRIRNIHPVYIGWPQISYIYPDFFSTIDAYIQTNKPLVISQEPIQYGYCPLIKSPDTFTIVDTVVLSLPCK